MGADEPMRAAIVVLGKWEGGVLRQLREFLLKAGAGLAHIMRPGEKHDFATRVSSE
jgi:hypothetical protein